MVETAKSRIIKADSKECYRVKWLDQTEDHFPAKWFRNGPRLNSRPHDFVGMDRSLPAYCDIIVEPGFGDLKSITFDYSTKPNRLRNKDAGCSLGKAHFVFSVEEGWLRIFYRAWTWMPSERLQIDFDDIGYMEDYDLLLGGAEGKEKIAQHKIRERKSKFRKMRIEQELGDKGKLCCQVCDFDFAARYKEEIGIHFAEVHHLRPIALGERFTNVINDLAILCSNCHRMIHRAITLEGNPEISINTFRRKYLAVSACTT